MADVARLANVSLSTVSRVVNQRSVVNAETRARVESAIKALGYRPNAFARGLMLRRSEILGLMLPDLHGEFYSEIIRGANLRAQELAYSLMVTSVPAGHDSHSVLSGLQVRSILDGVMVMVSEMTDTIQEFLAESPLPFVVLDDEIEGSPHDSVLIDQRSGAAAMMEYLLEHRGIERIVFVGGLETNFDTRIRLDCYREWMERFSRAVGPEDVHFLDYEYDSAYELGVREAKSWAGRSTCVFAANDEMAAGIIAAAAALGLSVPDDLAVVGVDDTRIARMTRPALTTIRIPMFDMGAKAVELLCDRIADPSRTPATVWLAPELVIRESG